MTRQAQVIIVALLVIIIGLGVTVGALAVAKDDGDAQIANHMDSDDPYTGMMGAMAAMDADGVLAHMREVLGEDGYRRMTEHFDEHRDSGRTTRDMDVDQMMHSMMDGMMQHMPADEGDVMPPSNDQHHETPSTEEEGTP